MTTRFSKIFFVILFFLLLLNVSCQDKDDSKPTDPQPDLKNATIKDFPLSEVSYLEIKIVHPEIIDGEEKQYGEIEITIPDNSGSFILSLKEFDLDNKEYSISPAIGVPQDFSKGPVIYTISSNVAKDKAVHYRVIVRTKTTEKPIEPNPDLENARLTDFPLSEVSYLDIKIIHPEVVNGEEKKHGEIEITVPNTTRSLMLSLKQFDLDNNKYSISPSIGVVQDFSKGAVTYTISSNFAEDKAVHYNVKISSDATPVKMNTKISRFSFERSKNPSLATTIEAVKIIEYENYTANAIYILVPVGTDFSNLIPTVAFDAAKLYYSIGLGTEFKLYPEDGLTVDFKYPNRFYLQAENSVGTKSNIYHVIVDVKNPIKFDEPTILTPNVKTGNGSTVESFTAVAKWTNQGNHPITGMATSNYKDRSYPFDNDSWENANILTATLSNPVSGTSGVFPGEKGEVNVRVRRTPVTGKYKTTAVFTPTFSFNTYTTSNWPVTDRIEGIFDSHDLLIESTVEE